MVEPSAPAVRARRQLVLPVVVSLAMGCTFDDRPSLGRLENAQATGGHAPEHSGGTTSTPAEPAADAGSANLTGAAGGSEQPSVTNDASVGSFADAGFVSPDAAQVSVADPADAASNASSCMAGTYLGSFTCSIDTNSLLGLPTMTMAQTPLYFRSSSANELQVTGSSLEFQFNGFAITADLAGKLDCASGAFHADWVNGMFSPIVPPFPAMLTGTLDGTLDRMTKQLSGSWSFAAADGTTCAGPWHAGLQL